MVSITDITISKTEDPKVYSITAISDVVIGTDADGNPVYLSFGIRWNKNTSKSVLKQQFVTLYQNWKADRDEEAAVKTALMAALE